MVQWCQGIIWINAALLLMGPLGIKFNEIEVQQNWIWNCYLQKGSHFVSTPMF